MAMPLVRGNMVDTLGWDIEGQILLHYYTTLSLHQLLERRASEISPGEHECDFDMISFSTAIGDMSDCGIHVKGQCVTPVPDVINFIFSSVAWVLAGRMRSGIV